jgi:BolA family transcriptional regulator, general stress-responsive regulator
MSYGIIFSMTMKEKIEEALKKAFNPEDLQVVDNSHQHAGHAGMPKNLKEGTHFSVNIVSSAFEGKSSVERHRMIYAVTAGFKSIHALAIKAKTPKEAGPFLPKS